MVKILKDIILREDLKHIYKKSFGYQVKYFWRKGWDEIPELMVLIPPTILCVVAMVYTVPEQMREMDRLPRYYNDITIFRPNNPKVARIRTDDNLSVEIPR